MQWGSMAAALLTLANVYSGKRGTWGATAVGRQRQFLHLEAATHQRPSGHLVVHKHDGSAMAWRRAAAGLQMGGSFQTGAG